LKKLLVDFLPLLVFFVVYKFGGIYAATGAAIVATFLQLGYLKFTKQTIEPMHWLGFVIVIVFGGLTIYLQDERFIKLKPSILYWAFAVTLLVGLFIMKRNLLKSLLGSKLELPDHAWNVLAWMWIVFFGFMGALNLYIANRFPTATWVDFKVWWSMGLILTFSVLQALYMSKFMIEPEAPGQAKEPISKPNEPNTNPKAKASDGANR
jgi:intracellular septation protein